ncbi:energy-coupling factor transporter ATP-binding protein EcfA2 [Actinomadura luteofluorescens]|uniref:Energy-coupling factor transporter ATP-binding protein EcfA2 n=1 Tax=Actinomadura luteofluorescens TaxID=46163 RepID=A0A7Y9JIF4_9ACTN|nr:AAA family ATPase [Actinomadura luteofluorescens]NYD50332.1 energy-coupling factor transporter ATP-binding protein EcfA2 [Actinomadura luteofluorescens]
MTPPAEQSTVHDEEAGAGSGRAGEPAPDEAAASGETTGGEDASEKDTGGRDTAREKQTSKEGAGEDDAAAPEGEATDAEKAEAKPRRGRRRAPRAGATVNRGELVRTLTALREQLGAFDLLLDVPGVEQAREARDELRAQLVDYVLPRVQASGAPMLVVLGGSTGAGKSTLVNTLVGARVSATGVLRPTTSSPILVCHPDHVRWFMEGPMLPGMGRVRGPAPDAIAGDQLVVIASDVLPPGLALLDSPDFDSVFEDHYEFATKLMAAADLWLCVTTAARYADAQVWQMLQRAKENGATIGVVLSRVPQGAGAGGGEIVEHFAEMLDEHEVGDARRFTIPETRIEESRLPEETVEDIRDWLTGVAEDAEDREIVVSDTLAAVLDSFRTRVPELARQVEAQVERRTELAREVEAGYGTALAELDEATRNGSLLRGEVLARWQDFAGTGDLLRALHVQRSRRGRAANRRHRSPARVRALKAALRSGLESLIMASAEHGAEQAMARWREHPAGEQVLAGADAGLGHVSPELSRRVTRAVSAWQDHVQELIRTHGVTKRSVAKLVSFDTEAVSLVLMIGLLGYGTSDVAVEGGNSAVPQRLLKALFGAESLRGMGAKARADLRSRIGMLFDEEAIRFGQVLDSAGIPDETVPVQLYQATYNLEVAR